MPGRFVFVPLILKLILDTCFAPLSSLKVTVAPFCVALYPDGL